MKKKEKLKPVDVVKLTCIHKNAYHFHDNAPPYCPDCDKYLESLISK